MGAEQIQHAKFESDDLSSAQPGRFVHAIAHLQFALSPDSVAVGTNLSEETGRGDSVLARAVGMATEANQPQCPGIHLRSPPVPPLLPLPPRRLSCPSVHSD